MLVVEVVEDVGVVVEGDGVKSPLMEMKTCDTVNLKPRSPGTMPSSFPNLSWATSPPGGLKVV